MLWQASEFSIRKSVASAMRVAEERDVKSIAFPILGSGTGGFSPERALGIMREELGTVSGEIEVRLVQYRRVSSRL